ncbi:Zn-dependent protease (includes SpoIVFB) [Jannaschia faecimaris]|uniref:Zinc metalloprotease n=1 Tax=Jannaschia faecimaris TaxID=1244108 RepID=A0A1H3SQR8_9RHOB|nr:site-2 protease family protein [Jannaschia faecimaris]SDZ40346.1 Zn-dependent protease (includes SpoIVFB) [Jannaschia faecimaris]
MWGRSIRLTRVAGIDIRLDASWFLIAALLTWSLAEGYFPALVPGTGPAELLIAALISMLGLFGSLILHELSHAMVARAYGMSVEGITLFVFGGVAELRNEPPDALTEFRVAIVGPLASLAIAAIFLMARWVAAAVGAADLAVAVLEYISLANFVLAVFNLLPAFPLDGGRVLRAFLWRRSRDFAQATRTADRISTGIALAMMTLGGIQILWGAGAAGLWPVLLALFILAASHSARLQTDMREALAGLTVRQVMRRDPISVDPDLTLAVLVEDVMMQNGITFVAVVEDGQLLGIVDHETVRRIERENWAHTRVDDVFLALGPEDVVTPDVDATDVFERMIRGDRRKFPVVTHGRLVGVVTLADLMARGRLNTELGHSRG